MSTAYDEQAPLSLGPNYRKVWAASAASNLADGIFVLAILITVVMLWIRRSFTDAAIDAAEVHAQVAT